MRLFLAAAALSLAATPAIAHPEFDVPDVRRHVTASATVHVLATNRAVYRVVVDASMVYADGTSAFSWLDLSVARCAKGTCTTPIRYFLPIAKGTGYDTSDLKNVRLTVPAFGRTLAVSWAGAGPSGDMDTTPKAEGAALDLSTSWAAPAKVSFLGITCTDANAAATRRTTVYPTGFDEPDGTVPLPAKTVPVGQPKAARSCRPGPA